MPTCHRVFALILLGSLLLTGCGPAAPTAAPAQPTTVPTQKLASPTDMPPPPTVPSAPPTATPVQPTDAPAPTPEVAPAQLSVDEILAGLEGLPSDEFLEESSRQLRLRDPDILFSDGLADFYGLGLGADFTNLSAEYIRSTQRLEQETLALLRTYDRSALSADQQVSYDVLERYLAMQVQGHAFADYKILVNPVWGLQSWPIDFLLEHPLESKQDAENYIARLANLDTWVDQVIAGLERNEQVGAIPPRYVLEDTIAQLDALLGIEGTTPPDAETLELYTNFRGKVRQIAALGTGEQETLLDAALREMEETFIPAYLALKDHLVHLATTALKDPNEWKLPGGQAYYAYLLAYYTGTDLSADEIHAMGLAEVARIQEKIRDAALELGYPADIGMAELTQRIREESQPLTGQALGQKYEQILAAADQASDAYFDLRASAAVVIRPEPIDLPAYYTQPAPGSGDPGVMPVNLELSPQLANYNEYVLVHHETIPGHHTQLALAEELDLPGYQRLYSVNPYLQNYQFLAYTEGWALYAEGLAWEMGLYEGEPLANLGRLRLDLLRTVRMVVDTGIHAKGWTLDEAAAYLEQVTGMPQSRSSLTRYLVNPGYACSYNVAKTKILELRQRAMEQLGAAFDIIEFHNVVLGNGILPIGILEGVVNDWIAGDQVLAIDEFLEQSYRQLQLRDTDSLFVNGLAEAYGVANDRFTDISDAYVRETQQLQADVLTQLRTYDRAALTPDQQLSYDIYEWYLADLVRGHEFMYHDYPVNPLTIWGKQNWLIDFMVSYQPITSRQDAEDYVARLSQIDTWVEQLLEGLKLREQAGIVPPGYIVEESIAQVEGHLQMLGPDSFRVEAIALYTSFGDKLEQVEGLSAAEKQAFRDAARTAIEDTFIPAFLKLRDYLVYLETVAPNQSGVLLLPSGQAYYAYLLQHQAGTAMSPAQVHELGLSEVARLQAEIQAAAVELGYPEGIGMAELEERLAAEGAFLEGEALLAEYRRLMAAAEQAAGSFFNLLPRAGVVIQREPFGSGIGYYLPPPLDGSGPGVFYTNVDYPMSRSIIPSYIFHETVPGHHLQGALAQELDLPTFRMDLELNGYVEGWAVYAEQLAWEMGLYEGDPLGNLGRLEFELSRAARLVIDTGIHARGWTRQEAAAYYEEATGRPADPAAMNRYVILPGQGCGYTIGLLKIRELRRRAMDRLGDAFDIRAFHDVVLGHGAVPLQILEQLVDEWIAAQK